MCACFGWISWIEVEHKSFVNMTLSSYFGGVVKFLVELVELASYHYRIVRNLTFLLVGVCRSWLNWGIYIEVYGHLRGGSANTSWIGWISFGSLYDLKLLETSCSRRAQIMVELVELRYTLYHLSIWQYLATLEGVVQILVELVELTTTYKSDILKDLNFLPVYVRMFWLN